MKMMKMNDDRYRYSLNFYEFLKRKKQKKNKCKKMKLTPHLTEFFNGVNDEGLDPKPNRNVRDLQCSF